MKIHMPDKSPTKTLVMQSGRQARGLTSKGQECGYASLPARPRNTLLHDTRTRANISLGFLPTQIQTSGFTLRHEMMIV
ncbi:hypothetical protein QQP08_024206 [Theobroma cacao]|nr:hypothetical protein QQP08_024206 [Theobroma cacao]